MATLEELPNVLQSLGDAISGLPSSLSATTTELPNLLNQLSNDLSPIVPSIAALQEETLLTNATWLTSNMGSLSTLLSKIPASDVAAASREDLTAIVQLGTTRYDLLTLWAPDVYAIFL